METLFVFCDGGARGNPGPAAAGFVVKDRQGKILNQAGRFLGRATNNVAEYQGVIEALKWIKDNLQLTHLPAGQATYRLQLFLDSKLIVNQLNGLYKIKNANLRVLAIEVKRLEHQVSGKISYRLIPREKNYLADRLVNQVLDKKVLQP